MSEQQHVDVTPNGEDFWRTQGHQFDNFSQALNEFIDNAIANFLNNPSIQLPVIVVQLDVLEDGRVSVTIFDTGSGIDDFSVAFRFGDTSRQDGEPSEHGVGLKNALAYLNPDNNAWSVATRTAHDLELGQWRRVASPYKFLLATEVRSDAWPGIATGQATGTVIQVTTSMTTFKTITKGLSGNYTNFATMLEVLREELSFVYAGVIKNGQLIRLSSNGSHFEIPALEPSVVKQEKSGSVTAPWNGGLRIDYKFLKIEGSPETRRRYRATMSSSGVEIRIRGRMIEDNIFRDIWNKEKHNSFNSFLGIIDLYPSEGSTRPRTVSTKNKFRRDDEEVIELFSWIRAVVPEPLKDPSQSRDEAERRDALERLLKSARPDLPDSAGTFPEAPVFTSLVSTHNPRADLIWFDGTTRTVIECKVGESKILDLYQLLMLWDGCVADQQRPDYGWLVADSHSSGVVDLCAALNRRSDSEGNPYRLSLREWRDFSHEY